MVRLVDWMERHQVALYLGAIVFGVASSPVGDHPPVGGEILRRRVRRRFGCDEAIGSNEVADATADPTIAYSWEELDGQIQLPCEALDPSTVEAPIRMQLPGHSAKRVVVVAVPRKPAAHHLAPPTSGCAARSLAHPVVDASLRKVLEDPG